MEIYPKLFWKSKWNSRTIKILVWNIDPDLKHEVLRSSLASHCKIYSLKIHVNEDLKNSGHAKLEATFSSKTQKDAFFKLKIELRGWVLNIHTFLKGKRYLKKIQDSKTIFVQSYLIKTSELDIFAYFSKFGSITSSTINKTV